MALIKNLKLSNGVTVNYWVADCKPSKHDNKTVVMLLGYLDKESAQRDETGKRNYQPLDIRQFGLLDGIYSTGTEDQATIVYNFVKESQKESKVVSPEITADDGTITPAVTEEIEVNEFVDAVDDI
jgi:hypothetical protein